MKLFLLNLIDCGYFIVLSFNLLIRLDSTSMKADDTKKVIEKTHSSNSTVKSER